MSKLKKIIAILLAMFMLTSFVAGCGNKKGGDTDQNSDKKTEGSNTDGGSSNEEVVNDDPVFAGLKFVPGNWNFGGKEIVFSGWQGPAMERGVNAQWDRQFAMWDKTEKKYNVKIKHKNLTSADTFVEDVVSHFSSGLNFADVIFCPSGAGLSLLKVKGLAVPLNDYIDYNHEEWRLAGSLSKYVDGYSYSVYKEGLTDHAAAGFITYYNPEKLKNAGVEDIFELYQKGEWTWDKFLEIARKLTDGDNKAVGGSFIVESILASNGVMVTDMDVENKKFVSGLFSPAGEKALNFLRDLLFTYKVVDDTYGGNNAIGSINDGKATLVMAPGFYGEHFIKNGTPIKTAPPPKGPDITNPVVIRSYGLWNIVSGLSSFKPEEAITLFLDASRNDPNDPEVYIPDTYEDRLENWILTTVDTFNTWATEAEAKFWFDYLSDPNTISLLDRTPGSVSGLLKTYIHDKIAAGEDPRTCLEAVKPLIETALSEMTKQDE